MTDMMKAMALWGLCGSATLAAMPVAARTLEVGEGRDYKLPSAAIAAAGEGDHVVLAPGQYSIARWFASAT
ncbi:MAG: hypothetical protein WDN04_10500 [Rhodospirillales bacterium]